MQVFENTRLAELRAVAESNRPVFVAFERHIRECGWSSLSDFVARAAPEEGRRDLALWLKRDLPGGVCLYNGVAEPYKQSKAKWLLAAWVFRDAPEQRLKPLVAQAPGPSLLQRRAYVLDMARQSAARVYPEAARWSWVAVSEAMMSPLEGSRRAIKGSLLEAVVRRSLGEALAKLGLAGKIAAKQIALDGETFDVSAETSVGRLLVPVKSRETQGGGHSNLFTRDIERAVRVAQEAGARCCPVVIAEAWTGDVDGLGCDRVIRLQRSPTDVVAIAPELRQAFLDWLSGVPAEPCPATAAQTGGYAADSMGAAAAQLRLDL